MERHALLWERTDREGGLILLHLIDPDERERERERERKRERSTKIVGKIYTLKAKTNKDQH